MRKKNEITKGCMAKAGLNEMTFVLLARDKSASVAVRAWVEHRLATGRNTRFDKSIKEALECAETMEREQRQAYEEAHGR